MDAKVKELTSDELLVSRFQNGDEAAFEEMVLTYYDKIFARTYQLLKNREDAEEVTQDTFMRARKGLDNFRGDASFSTWLYQIATNLSHNRYWYWFRRKRGASMSIDQSITSEGDFTLCDILPAEGENPGEACLTQEYMDAVEEGMKHLSPKHKEILRMRNKENLSYEEIAERLNVSVGTVKSRIARARESLRNQLGSDFGA